MSPPTRASGCEPIDSVIEHAPDDVFAYSVAAINDELCPEAEACTICRDVGDELRGIFDEIINGDCRLATVVGVDEENDVGLRLIVQVEAHASIVGSNDPGVVLSKLPGRVMSWKWGRPYLRKRTGDGT